MANRKVALCIPSRDLVNLETVHSLMAAVGNFTLNYSAKGVADLAFITVNGTILPQMRNTLAEQAIIHGATHVLWVDSDMIFPANAIERLLRHDLPIVGVNYAQRKRPTKPTAARYAEDGVKYWVYTEDHHTGVEEVAFIGHGLTLVETDVYKHLSRPWYLTAWNYDKNCIIGEDVYFCGKLKNELDICPAIDHDLSKEIRHVGNHEFTLVDAMVDKQRVIEQIRREQEAMGQENVSPRIVREDQIPVAQGPKMQGGPAPVLPIPRASPENRPSRAERGPVDLKPKADEAAE